MPQNASFKPYSPTHYLMNPERRTMTDNPTMVLKHGGGRYSVTSSLSAPQELGPGTYAIQYSDMTGYSLYTLADLEAPSYRVYGRRDKTIEKVMRTYTHLNRSLGVLFEGDKGIGKSSTTMELARRMCETHALPVIMVDKNYPGLDSFLASLGECVLVFDEFEKNFPTNDDDGRNQQNQFLSLFDGTDTAKRLYVVTVNDTNKLSPFMLNRPGRFHYLISFDYPDLEAITEYMRNETAEASEKQIMDAVSFATRARLNYDHLRALVTELNIAGPDSLVSELVADLNIRDTETRYYDIHVRLANGTTLSMLYQAVELFTREADVDDQERFSFQLEDASLVIVFQGADTVFDHRTGMTHLDGGNLTSQCLMYGPRAAKRYVPKEILETRKWDEGDRFIVDLSAATETFFEGFKVVDVSFVPSTRDHARFF